MNIILQVSGTERRKTKENMYQLLIAAWPRQLTQLPARVLRIGSRSDTEAGVAAPAALRRITAVGSILINQSSRPYESDII